MAQAQGREIGLPALQPLVVEIDQGGGDPLAIGGHVGGLAGDGRVEEVHVRGEALADRIVQHLGRIHVHHRQAGGGAQALAHRQHH